MPDESQDASKHKVWQIKEEKLRAAREAISMGGLKTAQSILYRYQHNRHIRVTLYVKQLASVKEFIRSFSTRYQNYIESLGIDETKEVQRALNHYVKHTLPIEHNITHIPTDRAFYSLPNDKIMWGRQSMLSNYPN